MEMAYTELNAKLCAFLDKTPNSFFAVKNIKEDLAAHGFAELQENSRWQLQAGGKYYVSRNGSALLAFVIPQKAYLGFQVYACHCDSPAFKLKNNAEIVVDKKYVKLNVEKYGGMLLNTWLDRPLSVAGRVLCNVDGRLEARLVNVEQDLMMIPNLAIHMNREANEGVKLNAQTDMLPLIGSAATKDGLQKLLAEACGVTSEQIVDTELFLYNRMPATTVGLEQEYVAGGRLDDLQCVFAGLQGFLAAEAGESVPVFCMLDNEEVGSGTKQGAAATFFKTVNEALCNNLVLNRQLIENIPLDDFMARLRAPLEHEIAERDLLPQGLKDEMFDYYLAFLLSGIIGIYRTWALSDGSVPIERVSEVANDLTLNGLSSLESRFE